MSGILDTRIPTYCNSACKPSTSKEQDENKTEDGYSSVNKVSTTIAAEPGLDEVEFVKNNIFPSKSKPAQIRK